MLKKFENKKVMICDTKNDESYEVDIDDKENMAESAKREIEIKSEIPPELDEEFGIDDDLQHYEIIINFANGKKQIVSIIACDESEALKQWAKIENKRFANLAPYNWNIQKV